MKISRLIYLTGIFVLIMSLTTPALALTKSGVVQDGTPGPAWPDGQPAIFLPLVRNFSPSFTISGQIKDAEDLPLAGVVIAGNKGQTVTTDVSGVYRMPVVEGEQKIAASKSGYDFEPAIAELNIDKEMNNLNFTAIKADATAPTGCQNLLLNSDFEGAAGWTISPAKNPSILTTQYYWSLSHSMLSGVPIGSINPFPHEFTTGEFWQPTTLVIPATATYVKLKMFLLPTSTDFWGYHIAEQAAMDAAKTNAPDASESQYGHIRDATNTTTLRQLFKWFPIDSFFWLYREYDLREFRGQTISVLFGAANDGWDGNTALYVDNVILEVCDSTLP
jgi:hypothetical protein